MLTQILGWCSQVLIALLLVYALKGRFLTKYPVFYAYVTGLLLAGLLRFYFFTFRLDHSDEYTLIYWYTQLFFVAGGYGVLWQIYAHTLNPYPGTAKVAHVVVSTVFVSVWIRLFIDAFTGQAGELTRSVIRLEQDLHSVQAVLMILLLMLVWYYGISLGRNLRGLLLGYGWFIATRLIMLTLQSLLGTSFYVWWQYLDQICVLATLVVWSVALRSYQPNPVPEHEIELERDYELLAEQTSHALAKARSYLIRVFMQ